MLSLLRDAAEFSTRETCDPHTRDCHHAVAPALHEHPDHESAYYIFATVGLFNFMLPAAYYALSTDYAGNYYKRFPS